MWGRIADMGVNPSFVEGGMVVGGTVIEAGGTAVAVGAGFMVQLQAGSQMLLIVAPPLHVSNDGKSIKLKNPILSSGFPLLSVAIDGFNM
jgi:hypothetical protein